ncbi:unnamed protein product [Amoebophrya sp. A120]|nr:unnamed protein product [Amoebophrya sp. A120]|eukprot:GSA120T00024764001.1
MSPLRKVFAVSALRYLVQHSLTMSTGVLHVHCVQLTGQRLNTQDLPPGTGVPDPVVGAGHIPGAPPGPLVVPVAAPPAAAVVAQPPPGQLMRDCAQGFCSPCCCCAPRAGALDTVGAVHPRRLAAQKAGKYCGVGCGCCLVGAGAIYLGVEAGTLPCNIGLTAWEAGVDSGSCCLGLGTYYCGRGHEEAVAPSQWTMGP